MTEIITGDNTSPKELLRLIRQLDPEAVVVAKGDRFLLDSDIRVVDLGRNLMEIAFPVDGDTGWEDDAVRLWWDVAVSDLSRASYLAYGPKFYRFNHLGFWEEPSEQTLEALDAMRSAVRREEDRLEAERWAAADAELEATIERMENRGHPDAEARIAGLKVGAVLGVLLALWKRKH